MPKKLSQDRVKEISGGIASEGFDYYFSIYTGDDEFDGTILELAFKNYRSCRNTLERELISLGVELE